jgi:hypothetical protein
MCSLPHCSAYIGQILSLFCVIGKGFDDVIDMAVTYLGLTLPNTEVVNAMQPIF